MEMFKENEPASRHAMWVLKLQECQIKIGYRPKKETQNADFLSGTLIGHFLSETMKGWVGGKNNDPFVK